MAFLHVSIHRLKNDVRGLSRRALSVFALATFVAAFGLAAAACGSTATVGNELTITTADQDATANPVSNSYSNDGSNDDSTNTKSADTPASTEKYTANVADDDELNESEIRFDIGFRSKSKLDQHYIKHRREFGTISKSEYLRQAQVLRDSPVSDRIIETTQANGTLSRFDRETGGFIAFDRDGTLRTYFRPDDGEDYFWRAAKRQR